MRQWVIGGVAAAIVLVVAGALYFTLRSSPVAPEPEVPPITGAERAEEARVLITELETTGADNYDEAFSRAEAFRSTGQLADAQLLYFFAARNGHPPSAFALGSMNDPNHHSPETSLLPEPDAFQAYRWYTAAGDAGMSDAAQRLDALREWAEQAAAAGDAEAERLLLLWE